MNSVSIIGSGHVATHLAKALFAKGCAITQIYSRTPEHAATLAAQVNATPVSHLSQLAAADLCVIAVADKAIPAVTAGLPAGHSLVVHTSGATGIDVLKPFAHCGVLYPLQTFTATRAVDWAAIPLFIEANSDKALQTLTGWASLLSPKIYPANSDTRMQLHLSAVFSCNFTNYLLSVAKDLSGAHFPTLYPLVKETIDKAFGATHPRHVQTGPAARNDQGTINKHLAALPPEIQSLYAEITKLIYETGKRT